jgi:Ca-activated chloride channel family protein
MILLLSSFYKIRVEDEATLSGKQTQKKSSVRFSTGFQNDYYTSNQLQGHYYAEIQADEMRHESSQHVPLNLSIVIDRSGSMSGEKIRNAKKAAKYVVDQLGEEDFISVVMYDSEVDLVQPTVRAYNKESIKNKIDQIIDRGSTNLMGGALKGFDQVKQNYQSGYINRVLLLSDGLANVGMTDPRQIEKIIRQKNINEGISISTFGVGLDYNEDLMTSIAETGTGNYYFIGQAQDIAGIFKKELNGLMDIVAQQTEMQIRIPDFVRIDKVYGQQFVQEGRLLKIKFHDIFAEDTKGVLIKYTIVNNKNIPVRFDASIQYVDAQSSKSQSIALSTSCDYTNNYSTFKNSYSEWVNAQVALYSSNERLEMAMKEVDKGNYQQAKKIVQENKDYMKTQAPLVSKSKELQKAAAANDEYDMNIKNVESMPVEDVKYLQKASKSSNYEIRNKK